ncbi:MAG: hypothetical protein KIS96_03765 [Bauldia sp.]|nr:hypothetical protein [Bauldia sp.]
MKHPIPEDQAAFPRWARRALVALAVVILAGAVWLLVGGIAAAIVGGFR